MRIRAAALAAGVLLASLAIALAIRAIPRQADTLWALAMVFAAVFLASAWLMHRSVRAFDFHHLTIPAFWYFTYLAMIFFSSLYIAGSRPTPYRRDYLLAVASTPLVVALGVMLANRLLRFRPSEINRYYTGSIQGHTQERYECAAYLACLAVAFLLGVLYFAEARNIPLLYMLVQSPSSSEVSAMRETSFKLLSTRLLYVYAILRGVACPFLIALSLGYALRLGRWWWLVFGIALVSGAIYAGASAAKAPVAAILLCLLLYVYLYRGGRISMAAVAVGSALVLAFPLAVILLANRGGVGVGTAIGAMAYRLLVDPAETLYYYFEVVPSHIPHLNGMTISVVARFSGQAPFNLENLVALYMNPGATIRSGNANAAFLGDLYANFGIPGVLIGGVVAGVTMQTLQVALLRQKRTLLNMAVYAYSLFAFWQINLIALQTALLSGGALLVWVLSWSVRGTAAVISEGVGWLRARRRSLPGGTGITEG